MGGTVLVEIKLKKTKSYVVMKLIGQFWEPKDVADFEKAFADLASQNNRIIVADMSRLSFISSHGLGLLVKSYSQMLALNGHFILLGPKGSVRETIGIAGFIEFIKIANSADELSELVKQLNS